EGDRLPDFLSDGSQSFENIDARSSILQGVDAEGITYWTAFSTVGNLCLITLLPGQDQLASSTCSPSPGEFRAHGLGSQIAGNDAATRAYLVPDGYNASADGFTPIGTNIIRTDPYQTAAQKISLTPPAKHGGENTVTLH